MTRQFDVLVLGAGIVGVSTALHLSMQGLKVGLVDRRGAGLETSYGNAGVIASSYILPFSFPSFSRIPDILLDRDTMARIRYGSLPRFLPWIFDLYYQSRPKNQMRSGRLLWPFLQRAPDEHRFLMRGTDAEKHLRGTGRCTLYRNEEAFQGGNLERTFAKELGVSFDVFNVNGFRELEPHIKPNFNKVVRWGNSPRLNNPGAVTAAYAERFVREGGTFLIEDVKSMYPVADGWQVVTHAGTLQAARIVVCLGPWSKDFLHTLGYKFPMAPKRGYHRHYKAQDGTSFYHAITDAAWGYVMAPMEQGLRLTSGAEIADLDEPPEAVQIDRFLPYARELYPLGEPVEAQAWHGNRPCFADSLPVIGPAPRHPGLWFNMGHGHMGLTMGPSTARLLAEMMTGATPFCDPEPYRATRFRI